jgi:hypothetical protein
LPTHADSHNLHATTAAAAAVLAAAAAAAVFCCAHKAGARLFDLDYAGGRFGVKFGHCMSCLCAFSTIESENDPVKV